MGFNNSVGEGNADDRLSEGQKGETIQLAKRTQESLADEVKLLKREGLVVGDSALDSEMLNPQCLEAAQCPVAVASGIQTASSLYNKDERMNTNAHFLNSCYRKRGNVVLSFVHLRTNHGL
jgi:hypothetical protein